MKRKRIREISEREMNRIWGPGENIFILPDIGLGNRTTTAEVMIEAEKFYNDFFGSINGAHKKSQLPALGNSLAYNIQTGLSL